MKKALIVVQGINAKDDYLSKNISESPLFKSKYDEIISIPVEEIWDQSLISKFPFLGQNIGDIVQFFKHSKQRKKACKLVRKQIRKMQNESYVVDLLGHSLGCQIILSCGPNKNSANAIEVRNCFLLGSPLGFALNIFKPFDFRNQVEKYARKFFSFFSAEKIHYFYSNKDFVSKVFVETTFDIIESKGKQAPRVTHTGTKHKSEEYIDFLLTNKDSLLLPHI